MLPRSLTMIALLVCPTAAEAELLSSFRVTAEGYDGQVLRVSLYWQHEAPEDKVEIFARSSKPDHHWGDPKGRYAAVSSGEHLADLAVGGKQKSGKLELSIPKAALDNLGVGPGQELHLLGWWGNLQHAWGTQLRSEGTTVTVPAIGAGSAPDAQKNSRLGWRWRHLRRSLSRPPGLGLPPTRLWRRAPIRLR